MSNKYRCNKKGGITPSGTRYITSNGTYDVTDYASVNVNISKSYYDLGSFSNFDYTGSIGDIYIVHNIIQSGTTTTGLTTLIYDNIGNSPLMIFRATQAHVSINWSGSFHVFRIH